MRRCAAMCLGASGLLAAGCAAPELANGRGETITLQRDVEPEALDGGFALVDRRHGWMRYIVIEADGNVIEPAPGASEVDHFQPQTMDSITRAVTDDNQETQTPRPLLRR